MGVGRSSGGERHPPAEPIKDPAEKREPVTIPIVGIGASAGGLEALRELFSALPNDTGLAYVVIQHLDPKRESALTDILGRITKMQVIEATDSMGVSANHIYVIPPNTDLSLDDGHLRLSPRTISKGQHLPIDSFFRSLAQIQRSSAIGVILSGSGSDGSLGIQAIKAEGGLTFTQSEKSAKYPQMPNAAVASGCVDFTLDPSRLAKELSRISRHPYVKPPLKQKGEEELKAQDDFGRILNILKSRSGVDFKNYKHSTLERRILRRMVLHKMEDLKKYAQLVEKDAAEAGALYDDILINVTEFFRDAEVFKVLKEEIFPSIIQAREPDQPIRIWVPGCSSGEEVYSLVIVLLESLGETTANIPIQVFATDISERAIEKARAGIYQRNSIENISPERLARFFVKVGNGYKVAKQIRDMCVFATQNVTADPPFSNVDLISCRNLLIYLGPVLQKRVIPTFHYALKPQGVLLLGTSETINSFSDLFSVKDSRHKIYSKKVTTQRPQFTFPAASADQRVKVPGPVHAIREASDSLVEVRKEAERLIFVN